MYVFPVAVTCPWRRSPSAVHPLLQVELREGAKLLEEAEILAYLAGGYTSLDLRQLDEWDQLRHDVLTSAVHDILVPAFRADFERELGKAAEEQVSWEYACALRRQVMAAPYRRPRSVVLQYWV